MLFILGVPENFAKLQKNACAGVSFNKVAGLQSGTLLKAGCREYFPVNLAEF